MKFGIGQSVSRVEDPRLLKGAGKYVDDVTLPGQLYGMVFRSPYAHARVTSVDVSEAERVEGVVAVYTAGHPAMAALKDMGTMMPIPNGDGSPGIYPALPHLAREVVRYVGQPVVFIVAESIRAAKDASDLIMAEFEELPVVVDGEAALAEGAPQLHESAAHNRAVDWEVGDKAATDAAFASAAHVSKLRMENTRVIVNAMEPRAINTSFEDGRWDIWCATQGAHAMRGQLADVLGVEPDRLRVRVPDVGGGFGMKLMRHPEYGLTCAGIISQ
jgi:carbon-monoxide dehydrogenase large subunit